MIAKPIDRSLRDDALGNGRAFAVRIIAACSLALLLVVPAKAADVDWKMYGGASLAGPSLCFYDANSVARASSGYIRVWTKCLAKIGVESTDIGDKNAQDAAEKIVQ
jgi:hypothetical protein